MMVCILIIGIPATGKSYFSEYLSDYLNIPHISKDNIKEILFNTIGFKSKEEKKLLNDAATNELYYCAEQFMKHRKVFILESNFEKCGKKHIVELINKYNYKCVTVFLTGDYATIYERFIRRNKSTDRHPGHVINDFYPRELSESDYCAISFERFVEEIKKRGMDVFDVGDTYLSINTTHISEIRWELKAKAVKEMVYSYLSNNKEDI